MKNTLPLLYLLVLLLLACFQAEGIDLKFNKDGHFKILQFTDTHINISDKENLNSLAVIRTVTGVEKPDLVVFTGDVVTEDDPAQGYREIAQILGRAGVPWLVVFGNHESDRSYTRIQVCELLKKFPGCLNADEGGMTGNSNFVLTIQDAAGKPAAILYCLDSNSYSSLKPTVQGYGWFDFSQVGWYRKKSRSFTSQNNGKPLPALAFFHIPLPEYTAAWQVKDAPRCGVRNESECCPLINTGMFAAFLECGDVMGTFVGHDHLNDYITTWFNIALAYGRVSKFMKDPEDPVAGGRVIQLTEGKRQFETWIRQHDGKKLLSCTYPGYFFR